MQSNPEERSFAASLRDGVKELKAERGPCPSSEELLAFFEERLTAPDAFRVRNHVEACGLCDLVLGRLANTDGHALEPTNDWRRIWRYLWNPAVAYGLVALLLFPAYLGLRQRLSPRVFEESTSPAISIPSFSLDSQRGAGIAAQAHVVRLKDQDKSFILEFFVPMSTDRHYFAEIRDGSGRSAISRREVVSGDSPGKVSIVCRREAFRSGDYTVTVTDDSTARRFEYVFQVE